MPNLSIKNVPEDIVQQLRMRASANHRSLQGELMALVCAAVESAPGTTLPAKQNIGYMTVEEIAREIRAKHPGPVTDGPQAVDIIRAERDAR